MEYVLVALVMTTVAVAVVLFRRLREAQAAAQASQTLLDAEIASHKATAADAEYHRGFRDGADSVRSSIRYEREVFESRKAGVIKREIILRLRERVMLGNLQIAQSEHEITVSSEVDRESLWEAIQATASLTAAPGVDVVRRIAPAVADTLFAAKRLKKGKPDSA